MGAGRGVLVALGAVVGLIGLLAAVVYGVLPWWLAALARLSGGTPAGTAVAVTLWAAATLVPVVVAADLTTRLAGHRRRWLAWGGVAAWALPVLALGPGRGGAWAAEPVVARLGDADPGPGIGLVTLALMLSVPVQLLLVTSRSGGRFSRPLLAGYGVGWLLVGSVVVLRTG